MSNIIRRIPHCARVSSHGLDALIQRIRRTITLATNLKQRSHTTKPTLYYLMIGFACLVPPLVTAESRITIDATRGRSIDGHAVLQREKFFCLMDVPVSIKPGYQDVFDGILAKNWCLARPIYDLDLAFVDEDPNRPGFPDRSILADKQRSKALQWFSKTWSNFHQHGSLKWVGTLRHYPEYLVDPNRTQKGKRDAITNFEAAAELVALWLAYVKQHYQVTPTWLQPLNEVNFDFNWGWHNTHHAPENPWLMLAEFHNVVAKRLAREFPAIRAGVNVGVLSDINQSNFGMSDTKSYAVGWLGKNKTLIDNLSSEIDFISYHLYSEANLEYEGPEDVERNAPWWKALRVHSLGRQEALMDFLNQYMLTRHGRLLPHVITEYGANELLRSDKANYKQGVFRHIMAVNSALMTLMHRPQDVDISLPFIPPIAEHDPRYPWAATKRQLSGGFHHTANYHVIDFWEELRGHYLYTQGGNQRLKLHAFFDSPYVYVVIYNNKRDSDTIRLDVRLSSGQSIDSGAIKRLRGNLRGNAIEYHDFSPVDEIDRIELVAYEAAILRLKLSRPAKPQTIYDEKSYYADAEAFNATGIIETNKPRTFSVNIGANAPETGLAVLHLGLSAKGDIANEKGINGNLKVAVNGIEVLRRRSLQHTRGTANYWKVSTVKVPAAILRDGRNMITIDLSRPAWISSVKLVVSRRIR